jgi:tRNA-splicing ligase RtcB
MRGAVSPAAVGVDIGCGMGAVRTSLGAADLPESLRRLRSDLEDAIPVGFDAHDEPVKPRDPRLKTEVKELLDGFAELDAAVKDLGRRAAKQLGTLGGGNHFIELCLDTEARVWLMLHSGSRNIGKSLAEVHMARARTLKHNRALVDPDLAVFLAGTEEMAAYRRDLDWAQRYAMTNRRLMFDLFMEVIRRHFPQVRFDEPVLCHHNYVAEETHHGEALLVTRKGAISARAGQLGVIPGSMGTRSYVVRGLGQRRICSASHGAGRRMSRGEAKRQFSVKDLAEQTAGVVPEGWRRARARIPGAYKPIEQVMEYREGPGECRRRAEAGAVREG